MGDFKPLGIMKIVSSGSVSILPDALVNLAINGYAEAACQGGGLLEPLSGTNHPSGVVNLTNEGIWP